MIHLTKSIHRTVVLQDRDFRKTGFLAAIELAPEGLYLRRPRQPKRCALLLPWSVAWTKAGDIRAAQLNREKAAARKLRRARRPQ